MMVVGRQMDWGHLTGRGSRRDATRDGITWGAREGADSRNLGENAPLAAR